ncbi:hypothetical protein BJ138DRAFT_1138990 [Hygrophoropsis aurantiaca]|uniref:Uncharacterized protein n=1 Tax=Hygrophoropsis aurantiaca TaxID=72124 RepID=A0ACB8ATX3_9AGAM|nr:hypothetical protein BJ138DRAFT_1138990 [Hygrophoropsis aurantiaca]
MSLTHLTNEVVKGLSESVRTSDEIPDKVQAVFMGTECDEPELVYVPRVEGRGLLLEHWLRDRYTLDHHHTNHIVFNNFPGTDGPRFPFVYTMFYMIQDHRLPINNIPKEYIIFDESDDCVKGDVLFFRYRRGEASGGYIDMAEEDISLVCTLAAAQIDLPWVFKCWVVGSTRRSPSLQRSCCSRRLKDMALRRVTSRRVYLRKAINEDILKGRMSTGPISI